MSTQLRANATTRDIRHANRLEILRAVYALSGEAARPRSPLTRHALAARTGLSFPTVSTVVGELLGVGLLGEAGKESSAGGRPRARLRVDPSFGTLVGVDVAETYVTTDVYDAALRPVSQVRADAEGVSDPEPLSHLIADTVEQALAQAPQLPTLGVGVSLPGQVQPDASVSLFAPRWGWNRVPLEQMLRERLPHRLLLDNPLKAATLSELWFGHGRETGDLVTVNLGTGVGAGIAIGGRLLRGTSNNAGEWGHTTLVLDGWPCRCGRSGCVEAYLGTPGLMRAFAEHFGDDHRYLRPALQTHFMAAVEAGLRSGEADAAWLLDRFGHLLGHALADLVNMLNPELLVLSSWVVGHVGESLLRVADPVLRNQALSGSAAAVRLVASDVTEPVALGMAALVLEQLVGEGSLTGADPTGPQAVGA